MATQFSTNGTAIGQIKKDAKARAAERGEKLSAAQDGIARDLGYPGFAQLAASAVSADDEELILNWMDGVIERRIDFGDLMSDAEDMLESGTGDGSIREFWISWQIYAGEAGPEVFMKLTPFRPEDTDPEAMMKFAVAQPIPIDVFTDAVYALEDGRAGDLISLLNEAGLFSKELAPAKFVGEHEGLLQLILAREGEVLGERAIIACKGDNRGSDGGGPVMAFVNEMSDGRLLVSNGSEDMSDLKHRILDKDEAEQLRADIETASGSANAEGWSIQKLGWFLHDRAFGVLGNGPAFS